MAMASSTSVVPGWCLRFRGGAMNGRMLILKAGPNVVGSSGDCDIVLPGHEVLPRHLVFNVGELVVSLQKVSTAAVRLNGEEMRQTRRSLAVGDLVTVGEIELQVERSYPAAEPHDPMFAEPGSAVSGGALPERSQPAARRPPAFWAGMALLVLAVAGLLSLWMDDDAPRAEARGVSLAEIEQAVAPFREVEVAATPGGSLSIRGFVESPLRRQALQQALQRFGNRVNVKVYAADELVEQAQRYLAEPGVAIAYAGQGRLIVSGTGDEGTVREKVRRLSEDLHPAVIVLDKLHYRTASQTDKDAEQRAQWAAWQALLPARLVSITAGDEGLRSIQLANGSRYYEGAVLKSGAELEHIDAGGLVLREGKMSARPQ
jgi:type III secretion system YscD/HrpQ family protein